MSATARVFLIVRVTAAVILVGTGYVYPLLMANITKESGPGRVPLTRVMETIAKVFTMPLIVIQPLTGVGLILTTRDLWNPFHAANRWLFAAILLFVVIFVFDMFVMGPGIRRLNALAESGQQDSAAFEKDLAMLGKFGPLMRILFLAITLPMIWKPGAPSLHI